jgi:acyl carrier protein
MTQDDILKKITSVLHETFDIAPERVTPDARLYDDLDIDSIDAIDLIVQLKPLLGGRRVQPEDFKAVRTVQDVVNVIHALAQQPAA